MVTLSPSTLLDSPEIYKIESNLISLFERTFKKGINSDIHKLKSSVKRGFSSATFKIQIDKIIDDIYIYTIDFTDKLLKTTLKADFHTSHISHFLSASDANTRDGYLELTEEAVTECTSLASEITESIIRVLKDEAIYQEGPDELAKRVLDLWGGKKYKAESWARTFSADVATNTTLHRYIQQDIKEYQFYATIDERTSPQCRALNGTVFKCDSEEARQYKPPLHFRCRSTILPIPITTKIDDNLRYENRDFTKTVGQNLKFTEDTLDSKDVKNTFKEISKFKDKYAIPQYILNEDIEKRLMKLGITIKGD